MKEDLLAKLNAKDKNQRLKALLDFSDSLEKGQIEKPISTNDVNNHIHTTYSFSPYSPTRAVGKAYVAGLAAAGIVDHDSIAGAQEFIEAGKILGLPTTIGFELRATHSNSALDKRITNNPDQGGISYLTFHGVPHTVITKVSDFLKPISKARGLRNQQMIKRINAILDLDLDYELDVLPLSKHDEGGSVTERHLLYALALKLISKHSNKLVEYLKTIIKVSQDFQEKLEDPNNPYYVYDLLGLLKSELTEQFYLPADINECPDIVSIVDFANKNGIIIAYPYLGDVTESVTKDKRAQKFEDDYLDELFVILEELKIKALSYMPSRNSFTQLSRVRKLCEDYDFFQISGEDINSPRQSFICQALKDPLFDNLLVNTWALIGHEYLATQDLKLAFNSSNLPLKEKIGFYQNIALQQLSSKK